MGSRMRILLTLAAAIALVTAIAAPAASPSLTDVTNAKHFFWAPRQNPQGTVADSASNDLVYHGGSVGDGAIGSSTRFSARPYAVMSAGTAVGSVQTPLSWRFGFVMKPLPPTQLVDPGSTSLQYCVCTPAQGLPPTFPKKDWM